MKKIKVCSLFSGIGGFETGIFHALGKKHVELVFASEIDKFAASAYEKIYGHTPYGDIKSIHEKDVPDHDILVAGFPCQAFSVAGKRLGFEDTRGTLFFEIARIAKEKQPKVMLLENVKGLLNHDGGRTLEVILKTLSESGYAVDIHLLNSVLFNVPQNRERIFIVAVKDYSKEEWDLSQAKGTLLKAKKRISENSDIHTFNFSYPVGTPSTLSILDIIEEQVDEKYRLSPEKTASLLEKLNIENLHHETIIKRDGHGYHAFSKISPTLTANSGTGGNNMPFIIDTKQVGNPRTYFHYSPTLQANDFKEPKQIGLFDEKNMFCIRKVTPKECLRLQSFPDDYYEKMKEIGISDTQIYKMAGNAVTVNVIEAIVKQVVPYLTVN